MLALKIISILYSILVIFFFICIDCQSKEVSESIGCKIITVLQAMVLIYIILN